MSHILSFDRPLSRDDGCWSGLNWRVVMALVLNIAAWIGVTGFILNVLR